MPLGRPAAGGTQGVASGRSLGQASRLSAAKGNRSFIPALSKPVPAWVRGVRSGGGKHQRLWPPRRREAGHWGLGLHPLGTSVAND